MDKHCGICHNTSCSNHGKNISFLGDGWKCNYIPVPTNADRIRAMNDEELAIQILKNIPMHAWPDSVRKIYFSYDKPSKENPKKAWLEWLQQPPKGE